MRKENLLASEQLPDLLQAILPVAAALSRTTCVVCPQTDVWIAELQAGVHSKNISARMAAKGTPIVKFCRLWVRILRSVLGYLEVSACSLQLIFYWKVATVGGVELQAGVTVWGLVQIQS